MALHLIFSSKAPILEDSKGLQGPSDKTLLLGDSVYVLHANNNSRPLGTAVYYLTEDAKARGLKLEHSEAKGIDYEAFVQLCTDNHPIVSWT